VSDKDLECMRGIIYKCCRCGETFDGGQVADRGAIKCVHCGYKVLKKVKFPIVHRVKAV